MKRTYKNFVLYIVMGVPSLFLGLWTWLYLYDPFQIFHTPYFRDVTFSSDTRFQSRGVIRFYDFNSIILGSSILTNMDVQKANELLQNNISLSVNSNDNIDTGGGGEVI